ncbi:hypothetical protein H6P81_004337 [Aristolochia fimbriata]|uniref:Uncharacterized protein n=1 Tax=Aristolochia fimbriata TaxID=158543 RepID=A0AAV7FGR4_ARIFI|nr:hypothetical protein H6P81_004337 [Aristolochia fimbriata]
MSEMSSVLFSSDSYEVLIKVCVFLVVQALVFIILSTSSDVFSTDPRSVRFRSTVRSVSFRRILAGISDFPATGESPP